MLGIIIGVAAVVTTVGIGRGAAANISQSIQSQGVNLLIILPGATSSGGVSQGGGSARASLVRRFGQLVPARLHVHRVRVAGALFPN